jgi:RHS repeat-associated protein
MTKNNTSNGNESLRSKLFNTANDSTETNGFFSDKLDAGVTTLNIPQISLPKGGGAIKGIDEQFKVNAANGSAGFSVPLPMTSARNGFQPSLSLRYNSGSGNGPFGLGWDVDLSAIQRRTDKILPRYEDNTDSDVFLFAGAEDLQPSLMEVSPGQWEPDTRTAGPYTIHRYRPRIESSFDRIERIDHPEKGMYWKVTTRQNVVTFFGYDHHSRIADPVNPRKIYKWLPGLSYDDKGNWIRFTYKEETTENILPSLPEKNRLNGKAPFTNRYLKTVQYGNQLPFYPADDESIYAPCVEPPGPHFFQLVFDYGDHDGLPWQRRTDPFSDYHAGFEIRTYRLCRRILLYHQFEELGEKPMLVKSLELQYQCHGKDADLPQEVTYLKSITRVGHAITNGESSSRALPPFEFGYEELKWDPRIKTISPENIVNAPAGISSSYQWTDLYGEGLAGILTEQGNAWFYKHNLGNGNFTAAGLVAPKPSFNGLTDGTLQLLDLDADGRRHMVSLEHGRPGFFTLSDDNEWEPFRPFEGVPGVDWSNPYVRMLDLDGDGKPDLLVTEENIFRWYPSRGTKGFAPLEIVGLDGDEEKSPRVVFADPEQAIFLADMSGDGLTDIVRIRNGSVCYWPNTGYGRFGAKVEMADAPWFDNPDLFNTGYIYLADISGTGASDLIYLGKDQFRAWINFSGNTWSRECRIDPFFSTAPPDRVSVLDLLGNGTSCIVWSSPLPANAHAPMKYIDLMGGRKPHLMNSCTNNCGNRTRLTYISSTVFYIRDRKAGHPWITKLPFPVQCVRKKEVWEAVSNTYFVTEYDFHHGYFDHAEREFRGFGRLDQLDTQTFGSDNASAHNNQTPELNQLPVLTKTWFHLGAYLQNKKILGHYQHEYWYNQPGMQQHQSDGGSPEYILPDALFTGSLNNQELREAHRACKGMTLRQEVFALDGSDKQLLPYSCAEHNFQIRKLQPVANNRYAVFLVNESESITFSYEREISDPRVAHTLNLQVDELGNILRSVSVVYPRKQRPQELTDDAIWKEQHRRHILLTENKFTSDVITHQAFRLRNASDMRHYECCSIPPACGDPYFTLDELDTLVQRMEQDDSSAADIPTKKLLNHGRRIYLSNDLVHPLPEGQMDSLGILCESHQLVMSGKHMEEVFVRNGQRLIDDIPTLMTAAGYIDLENDGRWWTRSGRSLYEPLATAKKMFYQARAYEDPFGAVTTVKYYREEEPEANRYWMILHETIDALGNSVKWMRFNFRCMAAEIVRDVNHNLSEVLLDELGLVVASAIRGKEDQQAGDRIDHTVRAFLSPEESRSFFDNPFSEGPDPLAKGQALLGNASIRMLYDYTTVPIRTATITRETHLYDLAPGQTSRLQYSFEYYGGLGNTVLKKMQAPPGPAWGRNGQGEYKWMARVSPRWIGNGRTVLNNKGQPVKQYEPYFSDAHGCEEEELFFQHGVSPIIYYDPLGRLIRTEKPDGTFTYTKFSHWKLDIFDANDTVRDSRWYQERIGGSLTDQGKDPALEQQAAEKAAAHAGTFATVHLDSLGRGHTLVSRNKWQATRLSAAGEQVYTTRVELDIKGNLLRLIDARQNTAMEYRYDLPGTRLFQNSPDSGKRWLLMNVSGKVLRGWDDRGLDFYYEYDIILRPTLSIVKGGDGSTPLDNIFARMVYGESLLSQDRANEAAVRAKNVLGKPIAQYDTGGLLTTPEFDFKGLALAASRQLSSKYKTVVNWTGDNLTNDLEEETFTFKNVMDALGRIVRQAAPDNSIITPSYNETGLLNGETILRPGAGTPDVYLKDISYNEKGARDRISYGNGVTTTFRYDRETFRLLRLTSVRQNGDPLQAWHYAYDPVGNITSVEDKNIPVVFFDNQKITGLSDYTYDALYRVIQAGGRENNAALEFGHDDNWNDAPFLRSLHPGDAMVTRHYDQSYAYDAVGNILQMQHRTEGNNWTRAYTYQSTSNRLISTRVGSQTYQYPCNLPHGFMTAMPHLDQLQWNFKDELVKTVAQRRADGGTPETTWYQYDGQGQRLRKLTERQAATDETPTKKEERIYIEGYELYRRYQKDEPSFERTSLSLMDSGHRFVMVETVILNNGAGHSPGGPKPGETVGYRLVRYQFHNHVGSAGLELDESARVISYEEYHPFGTTAYQAKNADIAAASKRYRYTGMERDEETGLEYHSARYYLPWLGRWCSADPTDINAGVNEFMYCSNNPVNSADPSGKQSANDIGMGMMWDQMGREMGGMWESIFGGHAYINPRSNVVQIEGPKNGLGGGLGGVAIAITFRAIPIEDHPSLSSLYGIEMGAGLVPVADPVARLVTGESVTGLEASRGWAAVQTIVDIAPFAMELHALSAESRMASMDARMLSMDARMVSREGELVDELGHIGAGKELPGPSETNPTRRQDLCVADVGAHQANLNRPPGTDPITNLEFVEAAGREVDMVHAPIADTGEAIGFLKKGFGGLEESGRLTCSIDAELALEPIPQPGEYLAIVKGDQGGHALHATVTDEVIGQRIVSEGRLVTPTEALELEEEGIRVVRQDMYRVEYYDPQEGVCVAVDEPPRSFIRFTGQ